MRHFCDEAVCGAEGVGFPFLFGGTFIEALPIGRAVWNGHNFPSFSEGLSLRPLKPGVKKPLENAISLPFRRDFH